MTGRCIALVLATTSASAMCAMFIGCAGEDASRPVAVPPVTWSLDAARRPTPLFPGLGNGESTHDAAPDASRVPEPQAPRVSPEPSFGAGSVKPGDAHAFRLAAALRAMRANTSGANVLRMMSVVPSVIDAKARTGVDPFADGEWLLVYGAEMAAPGPNANIVRHGRSDAEVTRAIADGGFEARDANPPGSVRADLLGVRDVLLRPQPGTLALVPADRAADLGAALTKPIDPGVKPGELARLFIAEPAKLTRAIPKEVVRANVTVKPASDGGLELAGDADCGDAKSCVATATMLEDFVTRRNSMMVRIATRNLFSGLVLRADGTKLRVAMHASPDQVDAILGLIRAQLDLPNP